MNETNNSSASEISFSFVTFSFSENTWFLLALPRLGPSSLEKKQQNYRFKNLCDILQIINRPQMLDQDINCTCVPILVLEGPNDNK